MDEDRVRIAVAALYQVANSKSAAAGDHLEALSLLEEAYLTTDQSLKDLMTSCGVTDATLISLRLRYIHLGVNSPIDRDARSRAADLVRAGKELFARGYQFQRPSEE